MATRLVRLKVGNYRSLAELSLDFGPVNVFFGPNGFKSFVRLSLSKKDGWVFPPFEAGDGEEARINKVKAAFTEWVEGAGKDYRINKVVPKKGPQMIPPTPPQP